MKITIESTPKLVTLVNGDNEIRARVWQGATDSGIPVQCYITRIAPEIEQTAPNFERLVSDFERELTRQADPRPTVVAIPLRMLID